MSYSTDLAKLTGAQLARFATYNRYQLAGQLANLDFWLAQVRHGLEALDGYGKRFQQLKAAQAKHVAEFKTIGFALEEPTLQFGLDPPRRVPDTALRETRQVLCDGTYRFLVRCCNEGLLKESALRDACGELGIGIEATDLKRSK